MSSTPKKQKQHQHQQQRDHHHHEGEEDGGEERNFRRLVDTVISDIQRIMYIPRVTLEVTPIKTTPSRRGSLLAPLQTKT